MRVFSRWLGTLGVLAASVPHPLLADDERMWKTFLPEQRTIQHTLPPRYQLDVPTSSTPATVLSTESRQEWRLSLDEAIHIALQNAEAIRVGSGMTVRGSGQTIYDVAITNTKIDAERARFDPTMGIDNSFIRGDTPTAGIIVPNPRQAQLDGFTKDGYQFNTSIEKLNPLGGLTQFEVETNALRSKPRISNLNPLTTTRAGFSYVQPLLQGAGSDVTMAPIRIAQLETDRTFFQFKNTVQDLVYSVIQAYWRLSAARITVWTTEQQMEQGRFAAERAESRQRLGLADLAEVSQTGLAYFNFRSANVVAKSAVLEAENALNNLLFLSPVSEFEIVPSTALHTEDIDFAWNELLALVEESRPDLQELRTTVHIDSHRITLAETMSLPQLNFVAGYGWTNTQGEKQGLLGGDITQFNASGSRYTDWTLGMNFDMPLGLREGRANLRGQELTYARDLANLRQKFHGVIHDVAGAVRSVDRNYAEYLSFREAREAAAFNLDQQRTEYDSGRKTFLNLLQAIADWGRTVNDEIDALARFNTELANLERQTGTILETHAVYFAQDAFCTKGPLGAHKPVEYPRSVQPTLNVERYGAEETPPENKYFEESRTKSGQARNAPPDSEGDVKNLAEKPPKPGWFSRLTNPLVRRPRQVSDNPREPGTEPQ
jgi:outer membrane protein TolC